MDGKKTANLPKVRRIGDRLLEKLRKQPVDAIFQLFLGVFLPRSSRLGIFFCRFEYLVARLLLLFRLAIICICIRYFFVLLLFFVFFLFFVLLIIVGEAMIFLFLALCVKLTVGGGDKLDVDGEPLDAVLVIL